VTTRDTDLHSTGDVPLPDSTVDGAARKRRRAWLRAARHALFAISALAAAFVAVYAFRPRPVPIDLGWVTRGPLRVEVRESGMTRLEDRYLVSAPVTGELLRLKLEANDAVAAGQAVAEIVPTAVPLLDVRTRAEAEARLGAALSAARRAEAETARAATANELAERELARTRALAAAGAVTARDLDQGEFTARLRSDELASALLASQVAREEVRVARAALARQQNGDESKRPFVVTAPVSGHVLRVHRESAGVVAMGAPLLEVGDLDGLEVVVDVLTTDAVRVSPGTPASIEGWGGEQPLSGRVRKVELAGFTRPSALGVDEQRANVFIRFSEPRAVRAALGDGYRVEVRLVLWEAKDVVKLPQGAVFRRGDGWAAFRIEDGIARRVPVVIGQRGETEVEILAGLEPGDGVAIAPSDRVDDGVRVAAR
jgi:HlyD family secretion protein